MAYDGIITKAMVSELREKLLQGKIDKIYQPLREELVVGVHSRTGNYRLFADVSGNAPRVHLIEDNPYNPPTPSNFCMLLRKHLGGGRIQDITQHGYERIIEISFETVSELGFTMNKKLIFEIMGKHSNIILVDAESGNILDSIKHISLDTSRVRQVLPGMRYSYPPAQEKRGFDDWSEEELNSLPKDGKVILSKVGGISPQLAAELAVNPNPYSYLTSMSKAAESGDYSAHAYINDEDQSFVDYHIGDLSEYQDGCIRKDYPSLSSCIDDFFAGKAKMGRLNQSAGDLTKHLKDLLEKALLKKQRLFEDLLEAQDSEHLRLYGELLTANLHLSPDTPESITLDNYYDGKKISIPLDPRFSLSKNAQNYYKRYGKAKTAVKEKQLQLQETQEDIDYLESSLAHLEQIEKPEDLEAIREELRENGYIKKGSSKKSQAGGKNKKFKASPHVFTSPSGFRVLVGRNNKENDELTLRMAEKTDLWLHTKDIHGSHVIMELKGKEPEPEDIYFAAEIAAYYSKARNSAQVPVDYVKVRYVKKPAGAKPGMVIFTNNKTVYITPKLP